MPKGRRLSQVEQGKILAYREQHLSQTLIAKKLNRSRKAIQTFLADPDN